MEECQEPEIVPLSPSPKQGASFIPRNFNFFPNSFASMMPNFTSLLMNPSIQSPSLTTSQSSSSSAFHGFTNNLGIHGLPANTWMMPSLSGVTSGVTSAPPNTPPTSAHLSTQTAPVPASTPKKKRGRPRKDDTSKKEIKKPVVVIDVEAEGDVDMANLAGKSSKMRWEDKWSVSIIHLRGEMQEEFSKPPKQGVNLWRSVLVKLVSQHPDFNKDHEACRKRWSSLFKEYTAQKAWNSVSGNDRRGGPWYDLIDEYMGTRANVTKAVHGGSISSDEEEDVTDNEVKEVKQVKEEKVEAEGSRTRLKSSVKKSMLLTEMKEGRRELTEAFGKWEAKKIEIAESMKDFFVELVKKL